MEKVKNSKPDFLKNYASGEALASLISSILIVILMALLAAAFSQLGSRLIRGWDGSYLIYISIFLSLESIYTFKKLKEIEARERIFFRISEWIAFAIGIKILLYLIHNPAQLLADLPLWQSNFFQYFFTGEYMATLLISILVWWSSAAFYHDIRELFEREADSDWDDLGKLQNALHDIRNRISRRIFILGTLVVCMAVVTRIEILGSLIPGFSSPILTISPVINVVLYFVVALVLLTLAQFSLLRTRWLTQKLTISASLARNWLVYCTGFFLLLGVVVAFLPTNYSVGLFDIIRYVTGFLFKVLAFLVVLITMPISLCLSLFSVTNQETSGTGTLEMGALPQSVMPQSHAWWEYIRSFLFWLLFIGAIIFAFRYYLMQNTSLLLALRKIPVLSWLAGIWKGFWRWLQGANRQIARLVSNGLQRLRDQQVRFSVSTLKRPVNPFKLRPRERIIYFYINLLETSETRGIARHPAQTPYNYQKDVGEQIPEISPEIDSITSRFYEARYSKHIIYEDDAVTAGNLWEKIKAFLRSWHKPEVKR